MNGVVKQTSDNKKVNDFKRWAVSAWTKISRKAGALDFECAVFMKRVLVVFPEKAEFNLFVKNVLHEELPDKWRSAALASDLFHDRNLWSVVRMDGILELAKISDPDDRQAALSEVNRRAIKTHRLGLGSVKGIVKRFGKIEPVRARSVTVHPAVERDILLANLRRIVKKFPETMRSLDAECRKILGVVDVKIMKKTG